MTRIDEGAIHDRVTFEISLRNLQGDHSSFSRISFAGVQLGANDEWLNLLLDALAKNTTCSELDLSNSGLTDASIQRIAVRLFSGAANQLTLIDMRNNGFTLAGETVAQGLERLRPKVCIELGNDAPLIDGFVHDKMLIEGLTAWPAETLTIDGGSDFCCPREIVGSDDIVPLKKGFQGANGTKFTCEHATFELGHGTGNMVLKRLEPEAHFRLGARATGSSAGTLV